MKFSEKLTKLRKDKNMSQESLADLLDVSRQSVSKWESGQTYPEMDKLLTLCKIFNITLDDLTNDLVKYDELKTKKNFTSEFTYIIDKSIYMFSNMNKEEKRKCFRTLIILVLVLLLFRIPTYFIISLGTDVILSFPIGSMLFNRIWIFIVNLIYIVLFIFIFLYVYKKEYLDKFKEKETKEEVKEEIIHKDIHIQKEKKKSNFSLLNILGNIFNFSIKTFLILLLIPFVISVVVLFLSITLALFMCFNGLIYIGVILLLISLIVINILIIKILLSLICNVSVNFKFMLISLIVSLAFIGIGIGITLIDLSNIEYINEVPLNITYKTDVNEYQMYDNMFIDSYYINYITNESLKDKVIVEYKYYEDITNINTNFEEIYSNDNIYSTLNFDVLFNGRNIKKLIDNFIDNLKNNKIYNYDLLYKYEINVYTSSENIKVLKENEDKFYNESNY